MRWLNTIRLIWNYVAYRLLHEFSIRCYIDKTNLWMFADLKFRLLVVLQGLPVFTNITLIKDL